jgi:ketosteroid isomerase-like protein
VRAEAEELLQAFARSDIATIDRLCSDDVLLLGTDVGEVWRNKAAILAAFDGAFDLGVRFVGEPVVHEWIRGEGWLAGDVEFTIDGAVVPARLTMVFQDGLLVHAHYSTADQET